MVAEAIEATVRNCLSALSRAGIDPAFGVIYGSYTYGREHEWSDIDLIVVSPIFDDLKSRDPINRLWHIATRINSRIEPIPCGLKEWDEDDSRILVEVARREGRIIPLEAA